MLKDNTNPRELAFWKNRIQDRTLLSALRMYPEQAKNIFGAVPVMREDVIQLGMVLAARQLLNEPEGNLAFDIRALLGEEVLHNSMGALKPAARALLAAMLSPENQNEMAKRLARRIIHEATGTEPP
jgi:hypothetical protein